MKIAIIFALLISLVYSDDSFYPSMPDEFNEQKKMGEQCLEADENKDQCLSITLSNSNYKCCMLSVIYANNKNNQGEKICSLMYQDIKYLQEVYKNEMFKVTLREIFGYIVKGIYFIEEDGGKHYIADEDTFKMKQIYECNDGTATYSYGYDTYSSTDIAIFESGNHCLKYFYRYLYSDYYDENLELKSVSKNDCLNAQLTKTALDAGIKCGFYQFKINYIQGGSKTYQTCYLYNSNIISNGKLDEKTQSEISSFVSQIGYTEGDGPYSSYTTQFTDEQGNTYTFDMTGEFAKEQQSNLLTVTKYLYLMLIIFML